MPFSKVFRRAAPLVTRPQSGEIVMRRSELAYADLDLDRPEQALEALRRYVANAQRGEQLVPIPQGAEPPAPIRRVPPHLRHLQADPREALSVYVYHLEAA